MAAEGKRAGEAVEAPAKRRAVGRRFRLAIVGVGCENCTFSTLPTVLADFRPQHDAAKLREHYEPITAAKSDTRLDLDETMFLDGDFADVDFLFTSRFRAIPGGPIETKTFETILQYISDGLSRHLQDGALDGVWLDLHGAMFATGFEDAEGVIVDRVRGLVGSKTLLSASFDLHGNFSARLAAGLDMATAYRTAPHVDVQETQLKALYMLVRCLREERRPHLAYVSVPLGISGEMSNTADEPTKALYTSELHAADKKPGVIDASILIGYVWADEPRSRSSTLVTGFDVAAANEEALRLAQCMWDARRDFKFGVLAKPVDEAVEAAAAAARARPAGCQKPVIISDSGDNPTAGGVGDVPFFVGRLVALGVKDVLVQGPVDDAAVQACLQAGLGNKVSISIGGKLDYVNAKPLQIEGTVHRLNEWDGLEYETDENAGTSSVPFLTKKTMPRAAVVEVPTATGRVLVTLTSKRKPFHFVKDFEVLGLQPSSHEILVVKIGYLVPDLEQLAHVNIMALSPGSVFADVANLPYKKVQRPMFPQDPGMDWAPAVWN